MDDELRETEAIAQALFEAAAQGIVGVGADGSVELANEMAGAMFGYDRQELLGQPLEMLLPAFRNRSMGEVSDLQGRRKDGSVFPIEVSLTHLETSRGPLTFCFLTDISLRKQAEMQLKKSESELHSLVGSLLTAQEEERRRIARDLHDDVMQDVGLLSSQIDQWIVDLTPADEPSRERLQSLLEKAESIVHKLRAVSRGLYPSFIEELGLASALRIHCEELVAVHGTPIDFRALTEIGQVGAKASACLYRIAEECLQNAVRHAHATKIQVSIGRTGPAIELTVRDDGVGFLPDADHRAGLGLVSMRERVRTVRGTLSIVSRPGAGTAVVATVPAHQNR